MTLALAEIIEPATAEDRGAVRTLLERHEALDLLAVLGLEDDE
ncbi:hypothetical protein ACFY2Y_10790 [Janibacter hoylei]|nr:hypothetical protein [Janibacter hoylei]